ncbi:MAG: hypothetical protein JXR96_17665 [Deltaproteobacteria bacterium]|nr:hypothetical protein [Deltaproteobacteria bacterium]
MKPTIRLARLTAVLLALQVMMSCEDPRFRVRTPPGQQVDVFQQSSVPVLDVLWVVDNSSSMQEEQDALAENFGYFYDYLDDTGADFHIGVISTDVYNPDHQGRLLGEVRIIDRFVANGENVFADNVRVGTDGKGDEQGFQAAVMALSEPLISRENANFLREDAYLFIIFVSDEDDKSFGEPAYFTRRFEQIKGIGNDGIVKVAAVVELEPGTCPDAEPGLRYVEVAESSGGLKASICEENFADNLSALGFSAAGLKRVFGLSQAAVPESVQVWVKTSCSSEPPAEGLCEKYYDDCSGTSDEIYGHICILRQSLPDGWAYEEETSSIRFFGQAVPPFGAIIEVGYIPLEAI